MAKKKRDGGDTPPSKPKGLRKQLKKAVADLDRAVAKRDRAQARVEAMSIIVDEIRAQLAALEKAAAAAAAGSGSEAETETDAAEGSPAGKAPTGTRKRSTPASPRATGRKRTATGARSRPSTTRS